MRAGESLKEGGAAKFRNMLKNELLDQHDRTWRENGFASASCSFPRDRDVVPAGQAWEIVHVDLLGEEDSWATKMEEP
jgi:hypothetical protein